MSFDPNGVDRRDLFALVIYIPGVLGNFLDQLRRELVPSCNPNAHVSVLPPRLLATSPKGACEEVRVLASEFQPFDIETTEIAVFASTDVVYLEIGRGSEQLREMHRRMSSGLLAYHEPYQYHPHVTLAQELRPGELDWVYQVARQRWQEYTGPRMFRAERTVFVQNIGADCWTDLASLELGVVAVG